MTILIVYISLSIFVTLLLYWRIKLRSDFDKAVEALMLSKTVMVSGILGKKKIYWQNEYTGPGVFVISGGKCYCDAVAALRVASTDVMVFRYQIS